MINQIILSTNEDPLYMNFWKPVSWAYSKMFPECTVHLAFLTNREENDPLVKDFKQYGRVTLFKPLEYVPEFAQAKMIRFILASQQNKQVCYIDDIDLFPLVKSFITDKTNQRPKNHLLCVGGEVYGNNGCYPVSQMTAEGKVWKQFVNPNDLSYEALFNEWINTTWMFDKRENPMIPLDWDRDQYFSDERLLRRLLFTYEVPKFEIERGYTHFLASTIDRYKWVIEKDKLNNHEYFNAHGLRPYKDYEKEYEPLFEYIKKNY